MNQPRERRQIMLGSLICLLVALFQLSTAFSSPTYVGKYLNGYQLRVIQVEDWIECIEHCQDEPLCISYNFDGKNKCQLNRHGVEEQCQAERELSSHSGWIFQQIREVTKKTKKVQRKGSCPCNCGTPNQCYVEPAGYGEVPGKAAPTCQDILQRRGTVPDGPYYLQGQSVPVYCKMTNIAECGNEGGWTLVMKINGSKTTFKYDSKYWTATYPNSNEYTYKIENGANLDEKETKLGTFASVAFTKMCLGMKTANSSIHWIMRERSGGGKTMISLLMDSKHEPFGIPKSMWLSLLAGSSLVDDGETIDGVNVVASNNNGARVRIGMIAYKAPLNGAQSSYIGFGGDDPDMEKNVTCGNVHGSTSIPAFGYILVK